MSYWHTYSQPDSVEQALEALARAQGPARLIAGGTDLLLDLEQGRHPPVDTLVDVNGIAEMREIGLRTGFVFIGAASTLTSITESRVLQENAECLVRACACIGSPQVRNVATLGGNVAHALPAADGAIALLALGAEAQVASRDGRRWQPLEAVYSGPGRTTLRPEQEILVGFRLPARGEAEGSAFGRIMRPQGLAIAQLNMAAWVRLSADGAVERARLAVGPSGPVPRRANRAEEALRGLHVTPRELERVLPELLDELRLRTSPHRATQDYRRQLVGVLLRRVVPEAIRSASETHTAIPGSPA